MALADFGRLSNGDWIDFWSVIRETAEAAGNAMCSTDATIVLRERYETKFGIYNHDAPDPNRPLASLAQHWAEDSREGGVLYERMEQFMEREVTSAFGISFAEFIEMPTDSCKKMLELAGKRLKDKTKMAGDVASALATAAGDKP